MNFKRILCFFGLHWDIVTGCGGMGDGSDCEVCGLTTYGTLLHINSRKLGDLSEETGWQRNERLLKEWELHNRHSPSWEQISRSDIADQLDRHPTIKCRWAERCNFDYELWLPRPPRAAIWRKNMKYPECGHCFVEDPYE